MECPQWRVSGSPAVLVKHIGSYIRAVEIPFEIPALLNYKKEIGIEAQCNNWRLTFSSLKSVKFCKKNSHKVVLHPFHPSIQTTSLFLS